MATATVRPGEDFSPLEWPPSHVVDHYTLLDNTGPDDTRSVVTFFKDKTEVYGLTDTGYDDLTKLTGISVRLRTANVIVGASSSDVQCLFNFYDKADTGFTTSYGQVAVRLQTKFGGFEWPATVVRDVSAFNLDKTKVDDMVVHMFSDGGPWPPADSAIVASELYVDYTYETKWVKVYEVNIQYTHNLETEKAITGETYAEKAITGETYTEKTITGETYAEKGVTAHVYTEKTIVDDSGTEKVIN